MDCTGVYKTLSKFIEQITARDLTIVDVRYIDVDTQTGIEHRVFDPNMCSHGRCRIEVRTDDGRCLTVAFDLQNDVAVIDPASYAELKAEAGQVAG